MSKEYKNYYYYNKYEKYDDDYKKNNHFNKHNSNSYKNSNYYHKEKNNIKKNKYDNNKFEENRNYYKIEKRENNRNYYDKNRKNSYDYSYNSYSKDNNKKNYNKHHYHYSRSRSSSFKSFSSYSKSKSKSNSSNSTIKNEIDNNYFENDKKDIFPNINNINTDINNIDINNDNNINYSNNLNNNNLNNNNSINNNNNIINNNNVINNNNNMINNNLNNIYNNPNTQNFQNFQNFQFPQNYNFNPNFQMPQSFLPPSNFYTNQTSIFPQISNYFPSENMNSLKEPSNTLLISNLGADINKEILDDIFREKCIELQTSVPEDIRLIESLGIAYIIFPSIPVCTLVYECLKGKILINGNYYYLNFTPNLTNNNFTGNPHESVTYVTHINKANNFQTSMETTVHEDWYCEYCDCKNFSRRTLCFKCKKPKTINCRIAPVIKQKTTVIGENGAIPPSTSIIVKGEVIKNSNEAEVKIIYLI